jgi:hypothetical protein
MSSKDAQAPSRRKKSSLRYLDIGPSSRLPDLKIISPQKKMTRGNGPGFPQSRSFTEDGDFGIIRTMKVVSDRLKTFFLKLTRQSFWELGIHDASVAGYVAEVLTDFARADCLYGARARPEKKLASVVEVLVEKASDVAPENPEISPTLLQERELRKYLGDYTLFMSGMFRSYVERRGFLDYYLREGSRSYRTVSELDLSLYRTGFLLYEELSKKFEYYSGALDYMRKAYFAHEPGKDPFAGFLKQIEGWMKVNIRPVPLYPIPLQDYFLIGWLSL